MAEHGHDGFAERRPGDGPGAPREAQDPSACIIQGVPLFPLQNVVLFPGAVLPLHIFEQRYRAMAADALALKCSRTCAGPMDGRKLICMCRIRPGHDPMHDQPPLFDAACLGRIVHYEKLEDGRYNLLLQGIRRVRLARELPLGDGGDRKPYRRADLSPVACDKAFEIDVADTRERMKALCSRRPIHGTPVGRQLDRLFSSATPTVQLADILAFDLVEDIDQRQRLLEETDERRRVEHLWTLLDRQFPGTGSIPCGEGRFTCDA
jgi:hypothetical protein